MTIDWETPLAALEAAISGVASILVGSGGSGYTSPPTVTVGPPGAGGVQATADAVMGVGGVTMGNGGQQYLTPPLVTFVGDGSGATGTAVLTPFTIGSVTVTSGGNTYATPPTVQFSGGGGTGATATATLTGGQVTSVVVSNVGSGYTSAPTISFTGGGGLGATAVANLGSSGVVTAVSVSGGSSDFTGAPSVSLSAGGGTGGAVAAVINGSVVSITTNPVNIVIPGFTEGGYSAGSTPNVLITGGGGTGATATATASGGPGLLPLTIVVSGGSGYTSAPNVVIDPPDQTGPDSVQAVGTAVINGSVVSVVLQNGGDGYTGPTFALAFSGGGGTTQPSGTATVGTSAIQSITVTNGGYGYFEQPVVTITGGGGSGAVAGAVTSPSAVASVNVTNAGHGYTSAPEVVFIGGLGTPAQAIAVLKPTTVASVNITGPGTGYTSPPSVKITGGSGIGAAATTSLQVVAVDIENGGYQYATAPAVTIAASDGNGSGATAFASLSPALVNGDTFSLNQGIQIASEIAAIGVIYDNGIQAPPTARAVNYVVPPSVNYSELDQATRFSAFLSAWFSFPASWDMLPSSDPVLVMMRANLFQRALNVYNGVPDPFIEATWLPLYDLALPAFQYYLVQGRELTVGVTTPYDDNSPLGQQLSALIATAQELTIFLKFP